MFMYVFMIFYAFEVLLAFFLCHRARPVVTVSSSLKITPHEIDIAKEQCDKRTW